MKNNAIFLKNVLCRMWKCSSKLIHRFADSPRLFAYTECESLNGLIPEYHVYRQYREREIKEEKKIEWKIFNYVAECKHMPRNARNKQICCFTVILFNRENVMRFAFAWTLLSNRNDSYENCISSSNNEERAFSACCDKWFTFFAWIDNKTRARI